MNALNTVLAVSRFLVRFLVMICLLEVGLFLVWALFQALMKGVTVLSETVFAKGYQP